MYCKSGNLTNELVLLDYMTKLVDKGMVNKEFVKMTKLLAKFPVAKGPVII